MYPFRRLIVPIIFLMIIIGLGVSYYTFAEKWSLIDAFYMIVITLATVGYREVGPLSETGKIVTMGIIIFGTGTVVYTVGQVIEIIFEGQIVGYRRRKEMEKKISELKNHYIICGFGRVGHQVANEFELKHIPFVVVDSKPETAEELGGKGVTHIIGDMSSDSVLEAAGVKKAKGLIACADSDTANVYVTLAAREINPNLYIVSRASQRDSESKMKLAGANRIVSPYFISGRRMAAMVMKPVASEFLDLAIHSEHLELEIEEFPVDGNSKLVGKNLSEIQIKQKTGIMIIAVKNIIDGKLNTKPGAATEIRDGDVLVAIGASEGLKKLREMIG